MKRAQIVEPMQPLVISETDIPEPPSKGLVIKTLYSGICHSDLNQWRNQINHGDSIVRFTDNPNYRFPIVPGHEIAGIVHSLGSETKSLAIGDKVTIYPWISCGNCGFCDKDFTSLCDKRYFNNGVGGPGGYSSYVLIRDEKNAIKVPSSLPMEVACLLPCSGLTTYNAVRKLQGDIERMNSYKGKTSVLVVGAGGLGLWCLQLAKKLLPSTTKIVSADINENKAEAAKASGCDEFVVWDLKKSDQELVELTKKKAIDGGYDGIIDVVNSTATAERAFKCSHRGSTIVLVGLYGGLMSVSLPKMVHGLRTLTSVLTGTLTQFKELVKLASEENFTPPPIEYITLDDAFKGMCSVRDGKCKGRTIIKHDI